MTRVLALLGAFLISIGAVGCGGGGGGSGGPDSAPPPPVSEDLDWDQGNWDAKDWQ